jgi:hypothetical protein
MSGPYRPSDGGVLNRTMRKDVDVMYGSPFRDVCGQQIFFDDIVMLVESSEQFKVHYQSGQGQFGIFRDGHFDPLSPNLYYQIVGNAYQNPELIK